MNSRLAAKARLSDACELITDGTHFSPASFDAGEFMYVTSKNVREGRLDLTDITYVSRDVHNSIFSGCPVRLGDVLYVKDGANTGLAAINTIKQPFSMLSSVALIRPKQKELDARYLMHWLNSPYGRAQMLQNMSGAAIKRLVLTQIRRASVPLPPLNKQRRIAAILDQADDLRRKRREALKKLELLTIHLVADTFGECKTWTELGNVCEVQGGLQLSSARAKLPLQVSYLRVANVYRNHLNLDEIKTIGLTKSELRRTQLRSGDILFVEGHGNRAEVGRCAVWDGAVDPCVHQNHLIRARVIQSSKLDPLTLCRFLNGDAGRRHLLSRGKTTSGLNTITVSDVRLTPIPIFGQDQQAHLAICLNFLQQTKAHYLAHLAKLDALFVSLQHRAFRGEL